MYWYSTGDVEHETLRMVHFFALNDICHVSAQCTSVFRSCTNFDYTIQNRVVREKANLRLRVFADIAWDQAIQDAEPIAFYSSS